MTEIGLKTRIITICDKSTNFLYRKFNYLLKGCVTLTYKKIVFVLFLLLVFYVSFYYFFPEENTPLPPQIENVVEIEGVEMPFEQSNLMVLGMCSITLEKVVMYEGSSLDLLKIYFRIRNLKADSDYNLNQSQFFVKDSKNNTYNSLPDSKTQFPVKINPNDGYVGSIKFKIPKDSNDLGLFFKFNTEIGRFWIIEEN